MIHFLKAGRDSHESESIGREFQSEIVCGKKRIYTTMFVQMVVRVCAS